MTKKQFIQLHMDLKISIPHVCENIPIKSETDPTQDIPIKAIQITASGIPINVKDFKDKAQFSNLKVEQFTTIEKRNCDKFDQLGELQNLVIQVSKKGVTTNFVMPKKQQKKITENS